MIISSAIKLENGSVFVGKRHNDCFKFLNEYACHFDTFNSESVPVCGFINDQLKFLTREEAYYEALDCGQCKVQVYDSVLQECFKYSHNELYMEEKNWKPQLSSENLW